jgi:hypothetical protein
MRHKTHPVLTASGKSIVRTSRSSLAWGHRVTCDTSGTDGQSIQALLYTQQPGPTTADS